MAVYTGTPAPDQIMGTADADTIDGGAGADTLIGLAGDDTYIVDNAGDQVVEAVGEGFDTVNTSATWMATANSEIERIVALGTASINLTGNAFDQTLVGNDGANVLDGGAGADTMIGGKGNDTYVVDNVGDVVVEQAGGGSDTVRTSLSSYTLGANVENLTYTGTGPFHGIGNSLANVLSSYTDGTVLEGGAGDDVYQISKTSAVIVEAPGGGRDTVVATANFVLPDNVENLRLFGGSALGGYTGVGNALDNVISGDANPNTIIGMGGNDTLTGGAGKDTFVFMPGSGRDTITDYTNVDVIRLGAGYGLTTFATVQQNLSQAGANVVLKLSDNDSITFQNTTLDQFSAANFQLPLVNPGYTLTFSDEFNGPLSLYDPMTGTGTWMTQFGFQRALPWTARTLSGNGERQINVDPAYAGTGTTPLGINPFSIADGNLNVTIQQTPAQYVDLLYGRQFTSGLLTTQPSSSQTYGYYEIKAQLPTGSGAWPAFWLLPSSGMNPPEIDILEAHTAKPNTNVATIHDTLLPGGSSSSEVFLPDLSTGMHTYGFLWSPQTLSWYVDGALVKQMATPADMNQPMYMVLNLATDSSITASALPTPMVVDYVRAYATPDTVTDTAGRTLYGTNFEGPLVGGPGNDTFYSYRGSDLIDGGAGFDTSVSEGTASQFRIVHDAAVPNAYYVYNYDGTRIGLDHLVNVEQVQFDDTTVNLSTLDTGIYIAGTSGADTLTGTAKNDLIFTNGGSDFVDGGDGYDTVVMPLAQAQYLVAPLLGGMTLLVDPNGVITQLKGVEEISFLDGAVQTGSLMGGLAITGTDDADTLTGTAGADVFIGKLGDDTFIGNGGVDTVMLSGLTSDYRITPDGAGGAYATNVSTGERDHLIGISSLIFADGFSSVAAATQGGVLTGTDAVDTIYGGPAGDTIDGGANADVLHGGGGDDILIGGTGDDTLYGDSGIDTAVYAGNAADYRIVGDPTIPGAYFVLDTGPAGAGFDHLLDVEKIRFADGGADLATIATGSYITGTPQDDVLTGTSGNDIFLPGGGNDVINGSGGTDLVRFSSNASDYLVVHDPLAADGYFVWNRAGGDGFDKLSSVEELMFADGLRTPGAMATGILVSGTGSGETLTGTSGDDIIIGGGGGDRIDGGAGNDVAFYPDAAANYLILPNPGGGVRVVAQNGTSDVLVGVEQLYFGHVLVNTADVLAGGQGILGTAQGDTLTGGPGNDVFQALGGNDLIDGAGGSNSLILAGRQADYVVTPDGSGGAFVTASGSGAATDGQDHIRNIDRLIFSDGYASVSSVMVGATLTGTAAGDTIIGGPGADIIDGKGGVDVMRGGAGDDIYYVDNSRDVVFDDVGQGFDTVYTSVSWIATAGSEIEKIVLTGTTVGNLTGNVYTTQMIGNGAINNLDDGGGAVTMSGLGGNDVYTVSNPGSLVVEDASGGYDTVRTALSSYTLPDNVEALIYTGTGNFNALGNAGSNTITGGNGNDVLNGGAGADRMTGGAGDDTYYVDNTGDTVIEAANGGCDTVYTSLSSGRAPENVERLIYNGTGDFTGYANSTGTRIIGGSGNDLLFAGTSGKDILDGGIGSDRYYGSSSTDTFVLNAPGQGVDRVINFQHDQDHLLVRAADFGVADWSQVAFVTGASSPAGGGPALVYCKGSLYFDSVSGDPTHHVLIATLDNAPALTASDFLFS